MQRSFLRVLPTCSTLLEPFLVSCSVFVVGFVIYKFSRCSQHIFTDIPRASYDDSQSSIEKQPCTFQKKSFYLHILFSIHTLLHNRFFKENVKQKNVVSILFGTVMGTSEEYAMKLKEALSSYNIESKIENPSDWLDMTTLFSSHCEKSPFKPSQLSAKTENIVRENLFSRNIVLFVLSTTNQGDTPANFLSLVKELRKMYLEKQENSPEHTKISRTLCHLSYAIYALGDSRYQFFCRAGLELNRLLHMLGAKEFSPIGFDDRGDPQRENVFQHWTEKVINSIANSKFFDTNTPQFPNSGIQRPITTHSSSLFSHKNSLYPPDSGAEKAFFSEFSPKLCQLTVAENQINFLNRSHPVNCPNSDLSMISLQVTWEGTFSPYQAGDHIGIYPHNSMTLVTQYCEKVGVSPTSKEYLNFIDNLPETSPLGKDFSAITKTCSISDLLYYHLDFTAPLSLQVLKKLILFTSNPQENMRIGNVVSRMSNAYLEMRTNELPVDDAKDYSNTLIWSFADILSQFPSCLVPLPELIRLIPKMSPRYYSIASICSESQKFLNILVHLVPHGTMSNCIRSILDVKSGTAIYAFIRPSSYRLKEDWMHLPSIFICAGTGIAPILGFCQQREQWLAKQRINLKSKIKVNERKLGPAMLLFSSRSRDDAFIPLKSVEHWFSSAEWRCNHVNCPFSNTDSLEDDRGKKNSSFEHGILCRLSMGFSRDNAFEIKKYITTLLKENAQVVSETVNGSAKAAIYLSGPPFIKKGVEEELINIIRGHTLTHSEAKTRLKNMELEGFYKNELF